MFNLKLISKYPILKTPTMSIKTPDTHYKEILKNKKATVKQRVACISLKTVKNDKKAKDKKAKSKKNTINIKSDIR